MKNWLSLVMLVITFMTMGCSIVSKVTRTSLPEPRPLGRNLPVLGTYATSPKQATEIATGELTLRQALAQVLLHNPELKVFSWEIRVKEAEALQAGLLPNPELEFGMENISGSGIFNKTNSAENTISLSQLIQMGGKRNKSRAAIALEAELAGWDFEAKRLDVLTSATKAFVTVLAVQRRVGQTEELAGLTERFLHTVVERVEAGVSSPVEQTRAKIALSAALIAQDQARLSLVGARKVLAALWGEEAAAFDRAVGFLEQVDPIPLQEDLLAFLNQNPEIARWKTEGKQRDARLALECAKAIPDLTLSAGVRNFKETNDNAFVVGISVPLPIFDRNQGGIAAAVAARNKARYASQAAHNQAFANLAASYRDLSGAFVAAKALQEKILPATAQAFETIDIGYRAGKFGFLELLDAQRALFEVNGQYIEALAAYHQAKAEVERLIAAPLNTVSGHNQKEK
jgi:cobalt-zinc-cadmium efflux system outer membrane protein